jgi:ubiquitin carboxyl-terminal hydrolase L3
MYELDGRKDFPVNHGPCTQEELLGKAATKMKEYMQRDPEEMRFTMLALAPNQGE